MGVTSGQLLGLGLVDRVIDEPLGGAHRGDVEMAKRLKAALLEELERVRKLPIDTLLRQRHDKWRNYGQFREEASA